MSTVHMQPVELRTSGEKLFFHTCISKSQMLITKRKSNERAFLQAAFPGDCSCFLDFPTWAYRSMVGHLNHYGVEDRDSLGCMNALGRGLYQKLIALM